MNIIDLFSGAGGLTFGFLFREKNGKFVTTKNNIIFANEWDDKAAEAYRANYPEVRMLDRDICEIENEEIIEMVGQEDVDLIIGGPPCQSFSTIGQRLFDGKAKLYYEYLRVLNAVRPKMFLFENVRGLLSMREKIYERDENNQIVIRTEEKKIGDKIVTKKKPVVLKTGKKVIDIIRKDFSKVGVGYNISYMVLNATNYGVPQNRERVIIIGIRKDLNVRWRWKRLLVHRDPLTVKDAISDLPPVEEGETANEYTMPPANAYQRLLREGSDSISQHYCGTYSVKIRTVIQNLEPGQGKNEFNRKVENGAIDARYYLTSGYHNTYQRLLPDRPSTTITNNMCTPSSTSCIHYLQNRALTPREGARIQSFPDWFTFCGNRTDVTKQIGNAVPPLMAIALAEEIERVLGRAGAGQDQVDE